MNAKTELIEHVEKREVKYVYVTSGCELEENGVVIEGTLEDVLKHLDFDYDEGFGEQELFGTIWYKDGTWSDRREYDGAEWWEHHECPDLPKQENR